MSKLLVVICSIIFLVSCNQSGPEENTKVVGEYDKSKLDAQFPNKKSFEIGADADGKPLFKYPEKAFKQALIDWKDGFEAIEKEFKLETISHKNYLEYGKYGFQLTTKEQDVKIQGIRISMFFDIYENS